MAYTISLDVLRERGACSDGIERFRKKFGDHCEMTLEKAVEYVKCYGTSDLWWFYNHVEAWPIIPQACGNVNSNGNNRSNGNNHSNGTSHSFGLLSCRGAYKCMFSSGKSGIAFHIFNQKVIEARADELICILKGKLKGWIPRWTNIAELREVEKNGNLDSGRIIERNKEKAWASMPQEAIDWVKDLPEFDADIFFDITGIRV